jgi:hypothetical protein
VYTVVAGVLNLLVIYDGLAGPAFAAGAERAPGQTPRAAPSTPVPQEGAA